MDEEKLLIRIAEMYYQEDKKQSQISKELNIHRTTISRLLKRSREEGIVQITINYDKSGSYSLEQELEKRFGLEKAIVVPVASDLSVQQKEKILGKSAGEYFLGLLLNGMKIGFSWGHALAAMVEEMGNIELNEVTCLPMIGGPSGKLASAYHVNTIAYAASKKIGCNALMIDSPAVTETKELQTALMKNSFNQELSNLWKELDIAVFGIGSPSMSENDRWKGFYGEDVMKELETKEVAGDILSRFFDYSGNTIDSNLNDRIIGISMKQLKKVPQRIGIAESDEKVGSIQAALKGQLLTTLVTTEETAVKVLKME
ncbi:sugar-binding transcriptional regulator [Enterococcus sp. BWB1-3]|uniref:sugar-binding transcriptional regulator n=1 Tax=Enterococcus sp. BWB1-3 TaxID=2787713 RepID=UPI001923018F|nr:sugar-binding transcriptional regulator [Enterococcus sp. BWB1-3]MBL1230975.1 sugar-binding transcriptional regulator [Enterococcus sp. BWB1-3]